MTGVIRFNVPPAA